MPFTPAQTLILLEGRTHKRRANGEFERSWQEM